MIKSIWNGKIEMPEFSTLSENIKTDVLIIGGGITGILCAHALKEKGVDCVICEGEKIGQGITKNTTAKITSQHALIYSKLLKTIGSEKTQMYYKANENAILKYSALAQKIECDFEEKDAYTYSLSDRKKIEDEVSAVNTIGGKAKFVETLNLPFKTKGAVRFPSQAQFNPLKLIKALAEGLKIYEHTFINEIMKNTAKSDFGNVQADKIIVTTHFPFINKHGSYFLKMYQQRSYVIALEGADNIGGMYIDESENGFSFRNYKNFIFIGGGGHKTGKNGGNWLILRDFAAQHYPGLKEKYFWAAQDCMTLDSIPYIGHYSKNTPNLFVATGFNKWGMSSAMAAADILSDMVTEKKNEYSEVFNPSRSILKPQLFVNGFSAAANLITPTPKRCPHLGCALKWNKAEHTWDCPCHGSRFEKSGKLIDNPATGDAKI